MKQLLLILCSLLVLSSTAQTKPALYLSGTKLLVRNINDSAGEDIMRYIIRSDKDSFLRNNPNVELVTSPEDSVWLWNYADKFWEEVIEGEREAHIYLNTLLGETGQAISERTLRELFSENAIGVNGEEITYMVVPKVVTFERQTTDGWGNDYDGYEQEEQTLPQWTQPVDDKKTITTKVTFYVFGGDPIRRGSFFVVTKDHIRLSEMK